jgi:thiol-disulfide isomerase/thioredoxin
MKFKLLKAFLAFLLLLICQSAFPEKTATPNFIVKDLEGVQHKLSNYKGKWVLVNYWATWCPPCLEEVPDLINLYENRRKKDVMVIGVVFDYQNLQEVTDYIDDMLITYPIVLSDNAVVSQFQAVTVLPTTFIFNPRGELVKVKHGVVTKKMIEDMAGPDR